MEKHDLQHLEKKLFEFKEISARFADNSDIDELLKIIHHPGWTTPAEFALVFSLVESLHTQVRNVISLRSALLTGSKQVGTQKATAA
jgi:hypothetical protein